MPAVKGHNELRGLAARVAEEAGAQRTAPPCRRIDPWVRNGAEDIVTEADRETEVLIRHLIRDARPNDAFLGEEGGSSSGSSGLTCVVDPIDGTVNYLYDIPSWAVSVAVVDGDADPGTWILLAGAVVAPSHRETYSAALGGGATQNGKQIKTVEAPDLSMSLTATGFTYSS